LAICPDNWATVFSVKKLDLNTPKANDDKVGYL